MVKFGQKMLYSGKSGCIWAKVVVFGRKWLYSDKVVVFGQSGNIRVNLAVFGQKWLFFRAK